MKNINLKNEDLLKKKRISSKLSTSISVVVLGVSFLLYGVTFLLNYSVVSKERGIKDKIASIEKNLAEGEFVEVYDFSMKALDLKSEIGKQELLRQTKNIITISNNTLSSVSFVDLQVENKNAYSRYTIEMVVPNYEDLSSQISAYKQIENAFDFFLESSQETEGQLTANFSFSLGENINIEETSSEQTEDF